MEDRFRFRAKIQYKVGDLLIETSDKPQGHQGAHRFKGWYKQGGYILRRCNHPKANKRGYYPEHRLIVESKLGRILARHEVVHHKNQIKDDNQFENLEVISEDSKHAREHLRLQNKDSKGRIVPNDLMLDEIKIRLYDRNSRITKEYSLSKLINTRFVKGCFEFRGRSTGLKDKNGKLIYEGDILKDDHGKAPVVWEPSVAAFAWEGGEEWGMIDPQNVEVIGNIYENPELLNEIKSK